MYEFIKDHFTSSNQFIRIAAKSAYIEWHSTTGEVISTEGLHLIPGYEKPQTEKSPTGKYHIFQFIPKNHYLLVWRKANYFFNIQKRNTDKDYILSFALNYLTGNASDRIGLYANMQIIDDSGIASLTLSHTEALNNLNERIMIIAELVSDSNNNIAGVLSLDNHSNTILKNYEFEVLQLIAQGYLSDTISELLHLSKHTVDDCRKELLDKFDAKNIYQLISNAYQEGFI
jgi:DNA-binding CsgD family transcriptional regulator